MQKAIIIGLIYCLAACSHPLLEAGADNSCPNVGIVAEDNNLIQALGEDAGFVIKVHGYQEHCYLNNRNNLYKAVITPIFEIERLPATAETDVDFVFYLETKKGPPEYIGSWQHSAHFSFQANEKVKTFTGKTIEVRVPQNDADFEIYLGLKFSPQQRRYRDNIFE